MLLYHSHYLLEFMLAVVPHLRWIELNSFWLPCASSSACDLLLVLWFGWMMEIHHSHYLLDFVITALSLFDFMITALSLLKSNKYFALEKGVHIDKLWVFDKFWMCVNRNRYWDKWRKSNRQCEGVKFFSWCLGNPSVLSYHLLVLVLGAILVALHEIRSECTSSCHICYFTLSF